MNETYISANQLAQIVRVDIAAVSRALSAGKIPGAFKSQEWNGRWRIPMSEVEKWQALAQTPGLTYKEAAERFGVSVYVVQDWALSGRIKTINIPFREIFAPESEWAKMAELAERSRQHKDLIESHRKNCPVCGKSFVAKWLRGANGPTRKIHCSRACRFANPEDKARRSEAYKNSPRVQANMKRLNGKAGKP